MQHKLKLHIPNFRKSRCYELAAAVLNDACGNGPKGMVWVPDGRVVLGRRAGRAMMQHLLEMPRGESFSRRTAKRTPLGEISKLLLHKMAGHLHTANPSDILRKPKPELVEAMQKLGRERAPRAMTSWRTLIDSCLP